MAGSKIPNKIVRGASKVLDAVGLWPATAAVLIMIVLVFVNVVIRYLGQPLPFADEYAGYMLAMLALLAAGYLVKHNDHISVSIITENLSPRSRACLEIVTRLVALAVIALLFVAVTKLVIVNFQTGRTAWTIMSTPLAPVQLIMPIGFGLFLIQIVIDLIKRVKSLFRRE